jgi:hypothetical protein
MSVNGQFLGRRRPGPAPFGFSREDGVLVPDPVRQSAIQRMGRLRAKGVSLRAIAAKLKAAGIPISHMGVKKVLNRERGAS